jgi:hypothetical protein
MSEQNDQIKPLTLADVSVRIFMRCLFNNDTTGVPNWDEIYTSYIDVSGLSQEGHLGVLVGIHNTECRLQFITSWLETQYKIFNLTGQIYTPALDDIKPYGHRITADPQTFISQLQKIEAKEKKHISQLRRLQKELSALENIKQHNTVDARNSFVIMLSVLRKSYGPIDRDTTNMEDLAIMIKEHNREVQAQQNQPGA